MASNILHSTQQWEKFNVTNIYKQCVEIAIYKIQTVTLKMELLDISSKINDVLVKMNLNFA